MTESDKGYFDYLDSWRPIKERLGYDPFEGEFRPLVITVEKIETDFDNCFHVDTVEGLDIGSILTVPGQPKGEIVRVRAISTVDNGRLLFFDRGFWDSPVSEIRVGSQMFMIGQKEPKDLYPLMVTTVTKDGE